MRRELVRWMRKKGLTELYGLAIVSMSASSLRFEPRPDRNEIALRLIEPGKPNQNAYVESVNSRLRDECLN